MSTARRSLGGVTIGLVIVNLVNIAVVVGGMLTTHRASQRGENALVALVDDVTRASQAQATAERMIAVGRAYLLTHEPELLARAQAAEAKLTRTMRTIATSHRRAMRALGSTRSSRRETLPATPLARCSRVRNAPQEPRDVAESLRKQLIPARDEARRRLDALVARRPGDSKVLRARGAGSAGTALEVVLVLGVAEILGTILLGWVLIGRVRAAGPIAPEAVVASGESPGGARSRATQRMSHRMQSARFRQ